MNSHPHNNADATLKSYLDGSDGLSAAYQGLDQDEPPATLDARILAAGRSAISAPATNAPVTPRAVASRPPRRALAASFMVCTLSMLFYFSQRETSTPTFTVAAEAETAVFSPAPSVLNTEEAATAKRAEPLEITVSGALAPRAGAAAPAPAERTIVLPVRGSLAPSNVARDENAERFSAQSDEVVKEITVTGAAVGSSASTGGDTDLVLAPLDYRASRDSWLSYLHDLQQWLDANDDGTEHEEVIARLAQEKADYSAAYPDDDLDALLATP